VCSWQVDPGFTPGDYLPYYTVKTEATGMMNFEWADLEQVYMVSGQEVRELLIPLRIYHEKGVFDDTIESSDTGVKIRPGARLEVRVRQGLPCKITFDALWLAVPPFTDPVLFKQ